MSDQELKDLVASLAVSQAKTDEQMKRTDEKLERIGIKLGNISNNQGDVAEEYFINSLKNKLEIAEIDFDYLISNFKIRGKNIKAEYDILLINGSSVAIVEVKYKVHPDDLKRLPKKIEELKSLPQYKNYKVYAGVAGFYVPDEIINNAQKDGFFVLQRRGDVVVSHIKNLRAA